MITDLNLLKKNNIKSTKVCVIGGGTVGLFLANKLKEKQIPVTIIEAGSQIKERIHNTKYKYNKFSQKLLRPYYSQSFTGLGGTSKVWGGQMIPFQKSDIEERNYIGLKKWCIEYKEISKYFSVVLKSLKLKFLEKKLKKKKCKNYNLDKTNFDLRFSVFLKDKVKNFYNLFNKNIKDNEINIYTDAKVVKINNAQNNLVKNVIAKSSNGNLLTINADIIVISCGAVESTKLILNYDKQNNNFIKNQKIPLGNFLCDHLQCISGKFIIKNWKKFVLYFSPIYKYGLIHGPRLELKRKFQKENKLPSAYYQFVLKKNNHLKKLLIELIDKKNINFKSIVAKIRLFSKIIKDIYNLFYFRILNQTTWFSEKSQVLLYINIEQISNFHNKLSIFYNKNAKYNHQQLIINHKINHRYFLYIKLLINEFNNYWKNSDLNKIAKVKFFKIKHRNYFKQTYHISGTLRIGSRKTNSVVNKNLKLWGINNLYICSTAVFPNYGSANTGFCLLAMAERLGNYLEKKINKNYIK